MLLPGAALGGSCCSLFILGGGCCKREFQQRAGGGTCWAETDGMQQMKRRSSFIKWQMGWERNVGWLTAPTVSSSSESGSKTDKE